jgi:hypothetical protein
MWKANAYEIPGRDVVQVVVSRDVVTSEARGPVGWETECNEENLSNTSGRYDAWRVSWLRKSVGGSDKVQGV